LVALFIAFVASGNDRESPSNGDVMV
jgi:hypothetical protein